MNVQRFTGRTSRDAMQKVKAAFGDEAVVLSTKPCAEGVEILAMAHDGVASIERMMGDEAGERVAPRQARAAAQRPARPARQAPAAHAADDHEDPYFAPTQQAARPTAAQAAPQNTAASRLAAAARDAQAAHAGDSVDEDVKRLAMSTLSFQDYVRERLLNKRRQATHKDAGKAPAREHVEPQFRADHRADPRADTRIEPRMDGGLIDPTLIDGLAQRLAPQVPATPVLPTMAAMQPPVARQPAHQPAPRMPEPIAPQVAAAEQAARAPARPRLVHSVPAQVTPLREPPVLRDEVRADSFAGAHAARKKNAPAWTDVPSLADPQPVAAEPAPARRDERVAAQPAQPAAPEASLEMMHELRAMKGLIEERFGAIAFMEKLQRSPGQAHLAQKLLDCGFSPALIRKLLDGMPAELNAEGADPTPWAADVLERNLPTGEGESSLEDLGGVYALVGATGVGKTTTTAKLAATFAAKHGAANLGLITLDAYRIGAHEQLRAYGRILGVPVHTAHDRAALEDLLDLLSGKKLVLIDTAGMAQRDTRTRELLDMLSHRSIQKLVVLNAAAQGETIEDVMVSYRAAAAKGVVLSKLDEAVKLGPALDAVIRHKVKVLGVANGQRVPEDWHRLSAQALVHRALRGGGSPSWRLDSSEVSLVFSTPQAAMPTPTAARRAAQSGHAAI